MAELESMKNYNAIPILKVCPGKLTKTLRMEEMTNLEQKSAIRRSFFTSSGFETGVEQQEGTKKAHFELRIINLVLTKIGCDVLEMNEGDINLCWQFMEFPESIVTPTNIKKGETKFELSILYKIDDVEQLLNYIETNSLTFYLIAVKEDSFIRMGSGKVSLSRVTSCLTTKIPDQVELFYMEDTEDQFLIGTLYIWYLLDFNKRTVVNLNEMADQARASKAEDSNQRSSRRLTNMTFVPDHPINASEPIAESSTENNFKDSNVEVTEAEVKYFQEALFLVLNRNKALRITQSEISRELRDRAEWLNEEAIWRRTLQEYAILSGKNPFDVQWRQWRDDDTSEVVLRSFPNKPITYKPILELTICKVIFFPSTLPYKNEDIQQIYVEYSFLNKDGPEMESEETLTKPPPNEPAVFNFKKVYGIDVRRDRRNCHFISGMIRERLPLKVSIVSEPLPSYEVPIQTCMEIGYSEVDFFGLVQLETNKENIDYPIFDSTTKRIIGTMTIKVSGILAMRKMALLVLAPKDYNIIV